MQGKSRSNLPKLTDRIPIRDSDLKISPFCLGMVQSAETVCAAFDAGINFFFVTADKHWPLYEHTRKGLRTWMDRRKSIREEIADGVVSYVAQREFTVSPFLEVLDAIPGLKKIDVAIIGGAYGTEFMSRLQSYEENQRKERIPCDFIGATFHDRTAAVPAVNHNMIDIAFIRYNPLHTGAEQEIFPDISKNRKTLLFNFNSTVGYVSPERFHALGIGEDYWRPEITDCYRFALTCSDVNGLLCALATPKEIAALEGALKKGPLSKNDRNYLINLAALDAGSVTMDDATNGKKTSKRRDRNEI
jgi:hypothetical protein